MSRQSPGPWSSEVWRAVSSISEGQRTFMSWALARTESPVFVLQPQLTGLARAAARKAVKTLLGSRQSFLVAWAMLSRPAVRWTAGWAGPGGGLVLCLTALL